DVPAVDQALAECRQRVRASAGRIAAEEADQRQPLLRARRERPNNRKRRRAAEQRDELAPFPSMEMHPNPPAKGPIESIGLRRISQRVRRAGSPYLRFAPIAAVLPRRTDVPVCCQKRPGAIAARQQPLFYHLVSAKQERLGDRQPERLCGLEI